MFRPTSINFDRAMIVSECGTVDLFTKKLAQDLELDDTNPEERRNVPLQEFFKGWADVNRCLNDLVFKQENRNSFNQKMGEMDLSFEKLTEDV